MVTNKNDKSQGLALKAILSNVTILYQRGGIVDVHFTAIMYFETKITFRDQHFQAGFWAIRVYMLAIRRELRMRNRIRYQDAEVKSRHCKHWEPQGYVSILKWA
jgi:hypothetical protein